MDPASSTPALVAAAAIGAALVYSVHSAANRYMLSQLGLGAVPVGLLILAICGLISFVSLPVLGVSWVPSTLPAMAAATLGISVGFMLATSAYSHEDASIVGPILGLKVIFLAVLESLIVGRNLGGAVWAAALLSMLGVAALSQRDEVSLRLKDILRRGVAMVALAALIFAICDMLVIGAIVKWPSSLHYTLALNALSLAFSVPALLIWLGSIKSRRAFAPGGPLDRARLGKGSAALLASSGAIFLAQILFFISFALGGQVTLSNILYNTRGLFVILLMALLSFGGRKVDRAGWRAYVCRGVGAALVFLAVGLALPELKREMAGPTKAAALAGVSGSPGSGFLSDRPEARLGPGVMGEKATFGAGCFWGVEAAFRRIDGVVSTKAGYMGGNQASPSYEQVCTDKTGHAEVVEVAFDPAKVSYADLLEAFWNMHDPTTLNGQGPDVGTQYRSVIFFHTPEQELQARSSLKRLAAGGRYSASIVTEIVPAAEFWPAEEYHQRYLEKRGKASCPGD